MTPTLVAAGAVVAAFVAFKWWVGRPKASRVEIRKALEAGAKLVDVRTEGELASGHLEGAINLPVDQLASRLSDLGSKKRPVVLYCQSGSRSMLAAGSLRNAGFAEVYDLGAMRNGR